MKTSTGFTCASALLIAAGAVAIIQIGPCSTSVAKIGTAIGSKMAEQQMEERDDREAALKAEMEKLAAEREAANTKP